METFVQQLINGLTLGSIYALVALGYTMVYGILGLINFAHGEVVMIGALVALAVYKALAATLLPPAFILLIGLAVAAATCMALGWTIERIAYRPLRNAPRLAPLITAIGVSIVLQQFAMLFWGRSYHSVPALLP
ncbi:MAG: branched-chain amino acid ABC transporter permease, partial [Rhodocyclaceae bacterium]|nr:branched-chain amino acid ABC transporter permease [Rhodocyclaceae bacterium]